MRIEYCKYIYMRKDDYYYKAVCIILKIIRVHFLILLMFSSFIMVCMTTVCNIIGYITCHAMLSAVTWQNDALFKLAASMYLYLFNGRRPTIIICLPDPLAFKNSYYWETEQLQGGPSKTEFCQPNKTKVAERTCRPIPCG